MATRTIRVFLSSPGDVGLERLLAVRVLERLQGEFAAAVTLEPILWEDLPMRATGHFQEQIVPPSQTGIVVTILWSRLGTRLPADKFRRDDGTTYESGTEWEFEDAARSYRERKTPDLFVYRKTSDPQVSLSREDEFAERLRQKKALDTFIDHWFGNPSDSFKAAFTTFETPDQFEEKLETHLRAAIKERLSGVDVVEPPPASWHRGSPFRRLEVFEFEHASIFFGRTQAVGTVCDTLKRQAALDRAFVLVLGMSGCGKSSLVRAGVLPVLTQPGVVEGVDLWRRCVFRPGDSESDPIDALAHAILAAEALPELDGLNFPARVLAEHLSRAPNGADGPVRTALARAEESEQTRDRLARRPVARLAVVVDQLEEIFTRPNLSAADREKFLAALAALARSGLVWVVATMRSDFYSRCAELPELVALKEGSGQYDLMPPTFGEIGRMICHPASAAGLAFEEDFASGQRLDEALHETAFKNPEALPLLEFTLDELYGRQTDARLLTWAAYRDLDGLEGAIGLYAESVFQGLEPEVQPELPSLLRALVTVGTSEGEPVVARRASRATVTSSPARTLLLDALINARLAVTDGSPDGTPSVSLAHEALLRHWERLSSWVEANRKELDIRARVGATMERWQRSGRTTDLLLPEGAPLEEGLALLRSWGDELPEPERDFVSRCAKRARRNRRRKRGAVAALATLTVIAVLLAAVARHQARKAGEAAVLAKENEQKAQTQARLADSRRIAALSVAAQDKRLDQALILAVEAHPELTTEARKALIDALQTRPGLASFLHNNAGSVLTIAFSPDGKTLAAGYASLGSDNDGGVVLWDVQRRTRLGERALSVPEGHVNSVAFSPDGKTLAAGYRRGGFVGGVVLWDVASQRRLVERPLDVPKGEVRTVAFSPDGKILTAECWAAGEGDGSMLWDVAGWKRLVQRPLDVTGGGVIRHVVFSVDGSTLAVGYGRDDDTGFADGVVLWDVAARKRLVERPLDVTEGYVKEMAFSPDGKTLAVGFGTREGNNGGVVLCDVPGWKRLIESPLALPEGAVWSVAFSPDARTLAAGQSGRDSSSVVLFDMAARERVEWGPLALPEGEVRSVAFSPDGETLAAGYLGGGVALWDVVSRKCPFQRHVDITGSSVWSVAFSPDSTILAGGYGLGGVMLWDVTDRNRLVERALDMNQGESVHVAFSPESWILAASYSGRNGSGVVLWDVAARKRLVERPLEVTEGHVWSVAFSPDGKTIAAGYTRKAGDEFVGSGGIVLWDVAGRKRLGGRPLEVAEGYVESVAFSPDGKTLAVGYARKDSDDGGVVLWDVATRSRLNNGVLAVTDGAVGTVAFSFDGKTLAAGCFRIGVVLWDVPKRKRFGGRPLAAPDGGANEVAFSPDGRTLAAEYRRSNGEESGVVLWDVAGRERLGERPLGVIKGEVRSVAFSPDGKILAAAYTSFKNRDLGGVVLWDVDLESWKQHAGEIANRNFTRDEWRHYFPDVPYHATFSNLPVPPDDPTGS